MKALFTSRATCGSSPLTRGKQAPVGNADARRGLIPAHAGKTRTWPFLSRSTWAHPRSRGENTRTLIGSPPRRGSSPLTRGKPRGGQRPRRFPGLIPAHAGKTSRYGAVRRSLGAHPRSRGENLIWPWAIASLKGSSPLTRGKRPGQHAARAPDGLIPAHAGKTIQFICALITIGAHPRSRGENPSTAARAGYWVGSSPLTRGKRRPDDRGTQARGLIPAHAGKTTRPSATRRAPRAHPRSRGENVAVRADSRWSSGSSPLTRGKPSRGASLRGRTGLIPAHAGKTAVMTCCRDARRAHPRSRGENRSSSLDSRSEAGSSPLTRGKHTSGRADPWRRGLIPAHAGKTQNTVAIPRANRAHPRSRGENVGW